MVEVLQFPSALVGRMLSETDGADWTNALVRPNTNIMKKPKYYFYPESDEDVSAIVQWAARHKVIVAIKCGGNNHQGASSCDDGLVIDLEKMKDISVEEEAIRIGGGCRWGEVYKAAKDAGKLVVGGGANCVGVGGFLTGGGNGWFSSLYGTGCDNILEATVVVADGRILRCNFNENTDLFWAIRGGSSQFGVVTQFLLRSYPELGEMRVGNFIFPGSEFDAGEATLRKWMQTRAPTESLVYCLVQGGHDPEVPWAVGPLERQDKVFAPFREGLKLLVDKTFIAPSMLEAGTAVDEMLLGGPPRAWGGSVPFTTLWPGMMKECKDYMVRFIKDHPEIKQVMILHEMHAIKRPDAEGTSYHVRAPNHSYMVVTAAHENPADDTIAQKFVHDIVGIVRKYQIQNTGEDLGIIPNGTSTIYPPHEVWGSSYERLRIVKRKYDPECLFKLFHCIEPAEI